VWRVAKQVHSPPMTPTTAVVLAGGAIDAAWQQQTGARTRAEVPVGDAPMYLHVVRALRQVDAIGDILLIGDAPAGEGYTTLPPRDSLLENVRLGLERSPTDSALFATVDLPFLTPESVRFFLQESLASGAALTYAVVPADLCRERFPQLKRTTVRLREGELTGGNLFWAQRAVAQLGRGQAAQSQQIGRRAGVHQHGVPQAEEARELALKLRGEAPCGQPEVQRRFDQVFDLRVVEHPTGYRHRRHARLEGHRRKRFLVVFSHELEDLSPQLCCSLVHGRRTLYTTGSSGSTPRPG